MRMTDAILPGPPPRGNLKGRANHFSPSSRFPTGHLQDKPLNITEQVLSSCFPTGQQQEKPVNMTEHILSSCFPIDQLQDKPNHMTEHFLSLRFLTG